MRKALGYLDRGVEWTLVGLVALMVAVGGLQVFCRYVLNHSLSWSEEFQRFSHIWLVFLTIPVGYNRGAHIGMTLLAGRLPRRAQAALALANDMLWLGLACAIVFYTARILPVARHQTSPGLGLRMDVVYAVLVAAGLYLACVAVRQGAAHAQSLKADTPPGDAPC